MTSLHVAHVPGFAVHASQHAPESVLPRHTHEGPTVCCVMRGAFTEYLRGHALECTANTVKVTPAGEPHWNRFGSGATLGLMVELEPHWASDAPRLSSLLDELVHVQGGHAAMLARRIWRELDETDDAAPLAVEGLVLELLAVLARERTRDRTSSSPPWLRAVREQLHELSDTPTVQSLARAAGVHPATLTRAFRRAYGCPPGEYLRRLRLERAIRAVAEGRQSLAEIAFEAGFADQAHFTRAFRRATGWTPGAYRRALAEG